MEEVKTHDREDDNAREPAWKTKQREFEQVKARAKALRLRLTCTICGEKAKLNCPCETTQYCSKTCQKVDWRERGHREACKNIRAAAAEAPTRAPSPPREVFYGPAPRSHADEIRARIAAEHEAARARREANPEPEPASARFGSRCPICLEVWDVNAPRVFRLCCCRTVCRSCEDKIGIEACALCRAPPLSSQSKELAALRRHVEDQVPEAINFLGISYRDGKLGLVKSAKKAAKLFKRAVELGNLDALSNLGHLYTHGDRHGVKKDNKKAMQLFRMAADRGDAEAQAKVAAGLAAESMKALGECRNPDVVRYWKLAAAQGFTKAEFFLGQGYHEGFYGLDVDIGEGLRWYARAAAKGHEESIAALDHVNERLDNLADMMKRDGYYLDAARHYKLSVEQTASLHAMYSLGEMNYNGQGFDSRNYDEARRLWERAAAGGHEGAIAALAATAQHYAEDD